MNASSETNEVRVNEGAPVNVARGNVFKLPTDEQVIPPGEVQQLIVRPDMAGTMLAVVVGPNAKPVKLWVGKQSVDAPDDVTSWRPNLPVEIGKFIILTVKNTGDEPAVFRALFLIDAPNHKVVVGEPQAPPPMPAAAPMAAPMGLTQALPPGPATTPADHGVKPGANEVAIVMNRNEVTSMLEHLRTNSPLPVNVKHGLIRRLDDVMKVPQNGRR